ncbi:MAG TPA: DUF2889 domain-containing protein [Steroidobacteraceae bacterium]|jgi:hypothetical protein|nr:DUF2889 domain-containing protein [Steroidobacteraceae bacterium]
MHSFRRRIGVASTGDCEAGEVRASLEDDFHHFRVRLVHSERRIQALEGFAVRHPYTTCPLAAGQLSRLRGAGLNGLAHSVMRMTDASQQCTHLMELSGLAIAAAARSIAERWFDIEVSRRVEGRTVATLDRDGRRLLAWELRDTTIAAPSPYNGISLRAGMAAWALSNLEPDEAEAALILRRCALISLGRAKNLDVQLHAEPTGRCFVQQPERAAQGFRIVGSIVDFTAAAAEPCVADRPWLSFNELA